MSDLLGRLRQQSLTGIDRFGTLSPQLRRLLGETSLLAVSGQIEGLRFAEAAQSLEAACAEPQTPLQARRRA